MKDLRPPTLQTYTDKTYKNINKQAHIHTDGTSYSCTHVDAGHRHKHAYTHNTTRAYLRKSIVQF